MKITLQDIERLGPPVELWERLENELVLNRGFARNEQISLSVLLYLTCTTDAVFCWQAAQGCNQAKRLYAIWCEQMVSLAVPNVRDKDALIACMAHYTQHPEPDPDETPANAGGEAWNMLKSALAVVRSTPSAKPFPLGKTKPSLLGDAINPDVNVALWQAHLNLSHLERVTDDPIHTGIQDKMKALQRFRVKDVFHDLCQEDTVSSKFADA